MEKVKVTRDQADAIVRTRSLASDAYIVAKKVEHGDDFGTIRGLELDDLIRALYIGYEVEHIPTPREKVQNLLQTYYGYHPNDETMSEIESLYNINEVSE